MRICITSYPVVGIGSDREREGTGSGHLGKRKGTWVTESGLSFGILNVRRGHRDPLRFGRKRPYINPLKCFY